MRDYHTFRNIFAMTPPIQSRRFQTHLRVPGCAAVGVTLPSCATDTAGSRCHTEMLFAGSVSGKESDVLLAVRSDGAATIATRERGRWQNASQLTLPSLGVVHDGVASPVSGDLIYCTAAADGSNGAQYDVRWRTFRR